ncbi:MAG: S41 family peptidase [Dysgonamonadaceae bacterium]|nr:S41 family peptidase [Dysgonamonadaceae bacterium]
MQHPVRNIACLLLLLIGLPACMKEEFDNDPKGNFDALWQIIDEHYCFFESKNVDWDQVYRQYAPRVERNMSGEALFYLLWEMLEELRDGHVNLSASFDVMRYDKWYQDSLHNFNRDLLDTPPYLGRDYAVASGLKYKVLDDNIGYIYYESFQSPIGEGNLDHVIKKFEGCHGIIIDIRDNGGGSLTNVDVLAARFLNEKTLTGYIRHKTGKGHNDFSEPYPRYLDPSQRLRYQKPVVVLTNRRCYSAANDFVNTMKALPNVHILGSTTGGGGGLPFSAELPNGWSVRFSASPMLDAAMNHIEEGIAPDEYAGFEAREFNEIDPVIERAKAYIKTCTYL